MKFLNKSNEIHEMDDINDFCGLHELDIKALRKVIAGEMKTHRGFKLAEPKLNKPNNIDDAVLEEKIKASIELRLASIESSLDVVTEQLITLRNSLAPIFKEREKADIARKEANPDGAAWRKPKE